jgi:hypothetical protein
MPEKPRKNVRSSINKIRGEEIDEIGNATIEDRSSKPTANQPNRYQKMLEARKQAKREREEKKLQKPHIGNKKHIMKPTKALAEEIAEEGVEESEE